MLHEPTLNMQIATLIWTPHTDILYQQSKKIFSEVLLIYY